MYIFFREIVLIMSLLKIDLEFGELNTFLLYIPLFYLSWLYAGMQC